MLWTILAVGLILNGFFHNDAWEIASAVLFGALGFRRAVMQWEKPRALMNFGVIVLAIGLALWQMNRGHEKKEAGREVERAPAVAQNDRHETKPEVAPPPPQERTEDGVTWVRLEKEVALELSPSDDGKKSSIFNKPNNCMVQITPLSGVMGTTFQIEYENGSGAWERYDWHTMTGDRAMVWNEKELRVTTVEAEAQVQFRLFCIVGGGPKYGPVEFNSAKADGVVSGDAISSILKFKDVGAPCFVRLRYESYNEGDDIWIDWIAGSGKNLIAEYRGLFLPDTTTYESLRIQLKSGSYGHVQYALECVAK